MTAAQDQSGSRVGDCPPSPNCVSSRALNPSRQVAPIRIKIGVVPAWAAIVEAVGEIKRCTLVRQDDHSLEAEVKSGLFGFVDDLVLEMDGKGRLVHISSASRKGYWDLGVNRRRVQRLRERLHELGIAE